MSIRPHGLVFMFSGQAASFSAMTRERRKTEPESSEHPSGRPHSPPIPYQLYSQKPGSLLVGVKKSQLVFCQEGGKRVTALRRMTGEKKNKKSIFQNCWACCHGDKPHPLHLSPLTCCPELPAPSYGREIVFFFTFFLALPT